MSLPNIHPTPPLNIFRYSVNSTSESHQIVDEVSQDKISSKSFSFLGHMIHWITGARRKTVNDFKNALATEFGKDIAEFAFPEEDEEKAAWLGLSLSMVTNALAKADSHKATKDNHPSFETRKATIAQAHSQVETTQKHAQALQNLAQQFSTNPTIIKASTTIQALATQAQGLLKKISEAHFSISNIEKTPTQFSLPLQSEDLDSINGSFNVFEANLTTLKEATTTASVEFQKIQDLVKTDPSLKKALDKIITEAAVARTV